MSTYRTETSPNGVTHLVVTSPAGIDRCATCGRDHDDWPTAAITVRLVLEGDVVEHRGRRTHLLRRVRVDRVWHVYRDDVLIGAVAYVMRTRERRTPGRTYVNARWRSPAWVWSDVADDRYPTPFLTRSLEAYSKADAVLRVVQHDGGTR